MEKCAKKQFETPEIELFEFKNRDAILTASNDNWSPDIM